MRGPVIYATAVVVAVFLPELFTSSVQGHFVGPLALAFIFAVLASLLVAMTVDARAVCAVASASRCAPGSALAGSAQGLAERCGAFTVWRITFGSSLPC